ncbi:MAG: mismatch repair protein [Candidatus Acidiferrales bacterium]
MPQPHAEFSQRLAARVQTVAAKDALHKQIGNAKLATVIVAIVLLWLSLKDEVISTYWLAIPIVIYAGLAVAHEFALRALAHARTAVVFYERGLARLEDRWTGTGASGERFRNPKHVYADDLDIFGTACLFELLSTARLPMGEERLAQWLSAASPVPEIHERQKVIVELRDKLDLREELALLGEDLKVRLDPSSLENWAEAAPLLPAGPWRIVSAFLAISAAATTIYLLATLRLWPLAIVLALEVIVLLWLRTRAEKVVSSLACNAEGLGLFADILQRLEREPFVSPRLQGFAAERKAGHQTSSQSVRQLANIVYWIDAREDLLGRLLELPVLYTVQCAFAAESWRKRHGSKLRAWVDIAAEMEALLSLAGYSYEHPNDPFPEFAEEIPNAPAVFLGEELGHPLIPSAECVRNSVRLDPQTRLLLVSGSNMSGKSTYLRAAGINAVLALAGAPIRGKALRMTPVRLGTSIRRVDSLQEHRSSFYTEILRIRDVFELTEGSQRVLFLFDELLEGTNSNDRRIGSEGLLRALLERGAMGIVTTHDLALTDIAQALPHAVRNVHFQDYVEEGKMRFDHKLLDGVVAKSNALELMRLIGLRV